MKKLFVIFAAALAIAACTGNNEKAAEVEHQRDSLLTIIHEKDNELNDFMATFTEIQEGLRLISEAEGRVTVANGELERGNNRAVVKENMEFIRTTIENKNKQVAELKARLKSSSLNVQKMEEAIENLQLQVEAQVAYIQELEIMLAERDKVIAQQGADIANLNEQNRQKDEIVSAQDKEINAAYYVIGTKSELKNQNILKGVTGKLILKKGEFDQSYFTKIDMRVDKQIPLHSKSATVKTDHPEGSYTLTQDNKGEYTLSITDPNKFWKTTRYLVIQVK